MAGIYIHIPFCRRKCYYCDFYKTTNTGLRENFCRRSAMKLIRRNDYLQQVKIKTIYFGEALLRCSPENSFH